MTWIDIVTNIVTLLTGGGLSWLFFWKLNKKEKKTVTIPILSTRISIQEVIGFGQTFRGLILSPITELQSLGIVEKPQPGLLLKVRRSIL